MEGWGKQQVRTMIAADKTLDMHVYNMIPCAKKSMKPNPFSVVSFNCDTEEEEERHRRGVESRRKRREARIAAKANMSAKPETEDLKTEDDKFSERLHNKYTLNFLWKGNEKDIEAMVDKAEQLKDREFKRSLRSFVGHVALCRGVLFGALNETFDLKSFQGLLKATLKLRKDYPKLSLSQFLDVENEDEYDPFDSHEGDLLKHFRKTRTFAYMVFGLEYDSTNSGIRTISPQLAKFRTTPVGDFVYQQLYESHRTGETSGTKTHESEESHEPRSDNSPERKQPPRKIARKKSGDVATNKEGSEDLATKEEGSGDAPKSQSLEFYN
jgi:hypothetical protein